MYKPNNGIVTVPVYHNEPSNGFANLVGNPYPSAIDLDRLFEVNAGLIDPVAYVWGRPQNIDDTPDPNNNGPYPVSYSQDNFAVYNPNGISLPANLNGNLIFNDPFNNGVSDGGFLASCQSFFVQTISNNPDSDYSGNLIFNNSMRTKVANNTFMRNANADNKNKLWLKLENGTLTEQIGIAFLESCSDDYLSKEDVKAINGRTLNFYTQSTKEDLIIDSKSVFNDNVIIPLGITNLSLSKELTLSIEKVAGSLKNNSIYLVDNFLKKTTNLNKSGYTFSTNEILIEGRFYIKFKDDRTTDNFNEKSSVNFIFNKSSLNIESYKSKIKNIFVYDLYTPSMNAIKVLNENNVNNYVTQIYIDEKYKIIKVVIELENGEITTKKMIR